MHFIQHPLTQTTVNKLAFKWYHLVITTYNENIVTYYPLTHKLDVQVIS